MQDSGDAVGFAFALVVTADAGLTEIAVPLLRVSLTAVRLACAVDLPLGAALAIVRFPGHGVALVTVNALRPC